MRNPFPKIGKVIKYEFKHSARILLPLYGVLLVLGLLVGLSINTNKVRKMINDENSHIDYNYNTDNGTTSYNYSWNYSSENPEINENAIHVLITVLLVIAFSILTTASVVITIVVLARRFKQSMLGDEAYLNLSLPCTMGEQLWGRFIMSFAWILACAVVICLASVLCFIKMDIPGLFSEIRANIPELNEELQKFNLELPGLILNVSLITVFFCCWVITLFFVVNGISHLSKGNKGLIKFVSVIVLLFLYSKTFNLFSFQDINVSSVNDYINLKPVFNKNTGIICAISIVWSAIQFTLTQYIFTKKLNLE